jgi:hypothetical protein
MVSVVFAKTSSLKLQIQISLKDLVFGDWIDGDVANTACAEITVSLPGIGPRDVKANRVGQHVSGFYSYPLHVHTAIEEVRVN